MSEINEGNYLFIHYGYNQQLEPELTLLPEGSDTFFTLTPRGQQLTIKFDTTKRLCTGWHDLGTTESFPCPNSAELSGKYDTCPRCQQKTGFNPAFYHAQLVSPQQQARNNEPHFLYLAHFGPGVKKVGISWSARGIHRLLDQGARSWLQLGDFATAHEARMHEAQIARLPGVIEHFSIRKKLLLLQQAYDEKAGLKELEDTAQYIREHLDKDFVVKAAAALDTYYFAGDTRLGSGALIDLSQEKSISGTCIGMNGSIYLAEQDDCHFMLPLGNLKGYKVSLSHNITPNSHAPQQIGLF